MRDGGGIPGAAVADSAAGHTVTGVEHLESRTEAEVDRRISAGGLPELIGTAKFCELLGITRQGLYHGRSF